jgi:hypothetical protein
VHVTTAPRDAEEAGGGDVNTIALAVPLRLAARQRGGPASELCALELRAALERRVRLSRLDPHAPRVALSLSIPPYEARLEPGHARIARALVRFQARPPPPLHALGRRRAPELQTCT